MDQFVFLRESNVLKNNFWKYMINITLLPQWEMPKSSYNLCLDTESNIGLVANKIRSVLQKASQTIKPAKMLTRLLSANSYFTYFYSLNFLLFHSIPFHIHKPTEKTLTPRQIQLWHRFCKRKERESGSLLNFLLAHGLILIKPTMVTW